MSTRVNDPRARTGYWSGLPGWFRATAAITLIAGMLLHGSRLLVGPEMFQARVLTPLADTVFAVPMTATGTLMLALARRAILPAPWEKAAYWFVALFFIGSIALHLRTLFTWDTSYVNAFPAWYPYLAVGYLGLILVFCLTRRFGPPAGRA